MPNFKSFLAADVANTFFNTNEFAESVMIDGISQEVVIDNHLLKQQELKKGGEGLAIGKLLFHIKESDLEEPFVEQVMRFNNRVYQVTDVQKNGGIYTITLGGHRS